MIALHSGCHFPLFVRVYVCQCVNECCYKQQWKIHEIKSDVSVNLNK